jgi:hypothetical protein
MKKIYYLLAVIFFPIAVNAQSPDWFTDVSSETGIDKALGARVWVADVNGDNYPDLLTNEGKAIRNKLVLFLNMQNPESADPTDRIFADMTEGSGINAHFESSEDRFSDVAALADVDNDGDVDLVTSTYFHRISSFFVDEDSIEQGHYSEVLLNDGTGKFTIVPDHGLREIIIHAFPIRGRDFPPYFLNSTSISFLDYDNDGNIDMYFGTWFTHYNPQQGYNVKMVDLLFKGYGNGKFERIKDEAITDVVEPMYGINVTDWNNDGWQDVITSPYCRSEGSLFKNNGDGTFTDVAEEANYSAQHLGGDNGQHLCQWEAMPGDFDNDGDMDLLQVSVHGGYMEGEGRTTIAVNQGPENGYKYDWELDRLMRDAPENRTHVGDMGGQWIDLDNDGYLDVMIGQQGYENSQYNINMEGQTRLYVLKQNDEGKFEDITKDLGLFESMRRVHSLEPVDFDLDGDLDMLFSRQVSLDGETVMQMTLLENEFANQKNWLAIKLDAPEDVNQSAIGARVYVYTQDMMQMREIQAGAGHFGGQNPFIIHTGIEDHNRVDSLVIRWVNKDIKETKIYNPPINTIIQSDSEGNVTPLIPSDQEVPIIAFSKPFVKSDSLNPEGENQILSFDVMNMGYSTLEITDFKISDDPNGVFNIMGDVQEISLEPGESFTIDVNFDPLRRDNYYSTIDFVSNAFNGNNRKFDIYGIGYEDSPLIASEPMVDFGTIFRSENNTQQLKIKNPGELDLTITSIEIENNSSKYEILNKPEFPFALTPDSELLLDIDFNPQGEEGEFASTVLIQSDAYLNEQYAVELIGMALTPYPDFAFDLNSISIGTVNFGESRSEFIKITNSGDTALVISDYTFSVRDDQLKLYPTDDPEIELPYIVEVGETIDFTVEFTPTEAGYFSSNLTLVSNDPETNGKELKITGLGIETSIRISLNGENPLGKIYPNPADDLINFRLNSEVIRDGNYNIFAVNNLGEKVLLAEKYLIGSSEINLTFDVSMLHSGYYLLLLHSEQSTLSIPFVIAN